MAQANVIDGKAFSENLVQTVATEAMTIKAAIGREPALAVVLVGADPASAVYVKGKQRDCEKAGIASTLHRLDADASQEKLLKLIHIHLLIILLKLLLELMMKDGKLYLNPG